MHGDWYSVYVETRAPAGATVAAYEDAADRLMELLEDHSGTVSAGDRSWGATISVRAFGVLEAATYGLGLIKEMVGNADMPSWPQVRADVVRQDLLEEMNERPTLPELVSVPEAAEILGVSPQRVRELAGGGRGFPVPVYELRTGKLWLRDAIVSFGERWERKSGRPDRGAIMRERVASALLDNGMTQVDAQVWLTDERAVILQVKSHGGPAAQRRSVTKVMTALHAAGLGVIAEHDLAEEIEAYLAGGNPARVVDLAESNGHAGT